MMVIAVGPRPSVSEALSGLDVLLRNPTITLERVRVCKRDGRLLARPHELPETDEQGLGLWQKLMIHSSETARHDGRPLHQSLVRRLRQANVVGATTLRGIWGFYGDHAPQGDRLLQLRRHVPVVTIVVDTPERIATTFEIVDEVTSATGLVTSEMVPAAAAMGDDRRTGGIRLARHRF
jgi:PII-like signaling protein